VAFPSSGLSGARDVPPPPQEILAALHTALLIVNDCGEICDVNAATEILLNVSAAHIVGRKLSNVLTLPSTYLVSDETVFTVFDVELSSRRGGRFRADFHASPFPERTGWRLISLNPGAGAQHMGHRLERRSGARAAMSAAAMLAHEIKNPLSGIRGAAQLLDQRVAPEDAVMTKLIRTEVDRITALIDQMEGFTDTRSIVFSADNIHEIIDHAKRVAQSGFGKKLKINEIYDPSLPAVRVHRDSLIQILLNLFKNAAETAAGNDIRSVTLTTRYRHGVSIAVGEEGVRRALPIELCVIDDGPGAPSDIAETLFDPFISSKKAGRGLGLALVDKLVRDMGGIIQYAREGAPEMTVFRLFLPRAEQPKS
jgi:two-component system, NtrC family, nitrogen regulation sensor histidine kinase GlnL